VLSRIMEIALVLFVLCLLVIMNSSIYFITYTIIPGLFHLFTALVWVLFFGVVSGTIFKII
jgi:polyferredoxin